MTWSCVARCASWRGSWVSNVSLERSKQRLQALPYFEEVSFEKKKVEGSDDLVDVEFKVKEGPSAQLSGGIGYSQSQSFMLNGNYANSNFLGTGKRFSFDVNLGQYSKSAGFQFTNPYFGIDNISASVNLSNSDVTQFVSSSSDFSSKTISAGVDFSYPISEVQGLRFGTNATRSELLTTSNGSAIQAQNWVQQNGNPYSWLPSMSWEISTSISAPISPRWRCLPAGISRASTAACSRIADKGSRLPCRRAFPAPPWSTGPADYRFQQYFPIWQRFSGSLNLRASYGESFGDTVGLPPYRQSFAGGPGLDPWLPREPAGAKDNYGNPYGGNALLVAGRRSSCPCPRNGRPVPGPACFSTLATFSQPMTIRNSMAGTG